MVSLGGGERVYLAETAASVRDDGKELVLCVHGMSGAATNWTDFMAELAADYDCKALDLPGSGYSPPPASAAGYSIKALAATVIRLIETLGRGPVHLVGNSMGGAVSIRAAAMRPDLVRTLTLVSPVLPDRRFRRELLQFPLVALPVLGIRMMRGFELMPPENRVAGVVATCFFDPGAVHPERFMLEVAELRRRDKLGYAAAAMSRAARTIVAETLRPRRVSLWRAAERIPVPVLVIFGTHDKLVSPRLAAPAARAFRDANVVVLPRTGHVAQMEHPALVAARFREMVEGTWARPDGTGNSGHRDSVDA
jgi:pimeloyl-ACP methyl ester carboxylesterase